MARTRPEAVVVLGAGMAGLCVALALAPTGRRITLLERDPAPPGGDAEAVFSHWARRGASQLRHSHAFLARLRTLLAAEHPALLAALRRAGVREFSFASLLPPPLARGYVPAPGDEALAILVSRRGTLESVMRRHVEAAPNVEIRSGVFATGLVVEPAADGENRVARGFRLESGEIARGDLVIDAAGRGSPMFDWMTQAGVEAPGESEPCAILYYTRFYRLAEGAAEPGRGGQPQNGDLGYLKFGVFPADAGTFSITLAVPEVEEALRAAVVRPGSFETICRRLPGVAPWTDPARARPVSRVFAMGDLHSRWRDTTPGEAPALLGAFSVGDSLIRTNPLFGRGCSFAAIEAHILRDVLAETGDVRERARLYAARVAADLRPFYDDMRMQDRAAARRALEILDPHHRPSRRDRLRRRARELITLAIRRDLDLLRDALAAFHMLAPPRAWLRRPATLRRILAALCRGDLGPPRPTGPSRAVMFDALGLPAQADWARLTACRATGGASVPPPRAGGRW